MAKGRPTLSERYLVKRTRFEFDAVEFGVESVMIEGFSGVMMAMVEFD